MAREGPSQIQFYILFPGYLEEMLSLKRPPFCQFFLPDVLLFSKGQGKGQQSDLDNGSTQETFQEEPRYPQSGLLLLGSTKNLEQFNVRVLLGVKIASRSESTCNESTKVRKNAERGDCQDVPGLLGRGTDC